MDYLGQKKPLQFNNPVEHIVATTIEEVLPALRSVQAAVDNGYYAAGYLSYETAPAFDSAYKVNDDPKMPLLWFGIFEKPVQKELQSSKTFYTTEWFPQTSLDTYNNAINTIKQCIGQGDTYQVNYTIRMQATFEGDTVAYYNRLAQAQSANYSAYLDIGDFTILSASPELFFRIKDGDITTKPMKGTVARGKTPAEDKSNRDWLYRSEKNRAENVMIVDLLRNDLGMIAKPGTIKVPELFAIEKYPTVYQMTSTVTAEVSDDKQLPDIFKALFPCGSITGAPKISTMNIINELEDSAREVYCGTIGFITPEQEAIFNVPIRTVVINNQTNEAQYGVGGGITWDSTDEEEYEEVLTKAAIVNTTNTGFELLESLGLVNGRYLVLEEHMKRLKSSAAYFNFDIDIHFIREKLLNYAQNEKNSFLKVRLLVNDKGEPTIEGSEASPFENQVPVTIANVPIDKQNIFLYHKTTNRSVYTKILHQHPDVFDILLWNEDRELTEFTTGNIVVEINNQLYTPPVESGLLAGTYRDRLLKDRVITERKITLDEIAEPSNIWLINSVREWVHVQLIKEP
ncbi:para-aminobenzoate synthetase/4-amino-4-deoxychorismate lyase [Virgibacillus natechei]|uniref:Para-aminobenzoate synthetase/4-amino-4-deoxychorismate lyase n=2 Tax=Virgibacillus natechei TaxID=1216297 RepID=A0ABS4II20_9BACI|nr:aminodeoxychorismate synthase component I [Virgibacillus natechei]MBP1970576.1 para-aminobenzoate synthetase/4-amino-4-deoxychorismate lyase [Virgibacillus natechei]UZD14863.1 aminodeoxychorismate synthase component I [Virgibacillus natechei]